MEENEAGLTLPICFRNEQWAVTGYGLECTGVNRCEIQAKDLGAAKMWHEGCTRLPFQMADKDGR
jgi:hypothetical protein